MSMKQDLLKSKPMQMILILKLKNQESQKRNTIVQLKSNVKKVKNAIDVLMLGTKETIPRISKYKIFIKKM